MVTTGKIGEVIHITGENIYSISSVVFGNEASGAFIEVNDSLLVTVPQNSAWARIRIESSEREITGYSTYFFVPEPKITGFYPSTGIPGSTININGFAFSGVTGVEFNNLNSFSVNVISNSGLTAQVPTGNTNGFIKLIGQSGLYNTSSDVFFPTALITGLSSYSVRTGDSLVISGLNFLPGIMDEHSSNFYNVSFNGALSPFELISSLKLTGMIPEEATSGPVSILKQTKDYHVSAYSIVILPSKPVLTSISPSSGKLNDQIILNGANFYEVSNIKLQKDTNYVNISNTGEFFVSSIGNVVYFSIPTGLEEGKHDIVVTASGGISSGINLLHVIKSPIISGFSPVRAKAGDILRISGSNLYSNSLVYLNSLENFSLNIYTGSENNSYLDVIVPGQSSLENLIIVDNNVGVYSTGTFIFLDVPSISGFTASGSWGQSILISGTGFAFVNNVYISNINANFISIGDTGISVQIPTGVSDGFIKIQNGAGETFSSLPLNVLDPVITISGFLPNPVAINNILTISGTYLNTATGVLFSGVSGLISVSDFTVRSGDILVEVPSTALTQRIIVSNESANSYGTGNLVILRPPIISGIDNEYAVYNSLLKISGSNFTGTEFYFRKYDGTLTKGSGTLNIGSTGASTFIPKGIITDKIVSSGLGAFFTSNTVFRPLPTIEGFWPSSTGSAIGDRITITGINSYEITGILMSGSGIHRNIIDNFSDLFFDNVYLTDKSVITGYLNGEFYGTGKLALIYPDWTGLNGPIPYPNLLTTQTFNITGALPTISGVSPDFVGYDQVFYISGSNLRNANRVWISGVSVNNLWENVESFDYVNHKMITGRIGLVIDQPLQTAKIAVVKRGFGPFETIDPQYSINSPNNIQYLQDMRFTYTSKNLQGDQIFTGGYLVISGSHLQGFPGFGYGGAYLRNSTIKDNSIPVYIEGSLTNFSLGDSLNLENIRINIPDDNTLTDQTFDIYFINTGMSTGILSGVKISNKRNVDDLNNLETKIYIFG